jgi:hypothetical protein
MLATLPDLNNTEPRTAPDEQEPSVVGFQTPHLLPLPPLSLSSSGIASESFPQYVNFMKAPFRSFNLHPFVTRLPYSPDVNICFQ